MSVQTFEKWLEMTKSNRTKIVYMSTVNQFLKDVDKKVEDLTLDDAINYLDKLKDRVKVQSLNVIANRLRTLYRFAGKRDIADMIPVQPYVQTMQEAEIAELRWLPEESIKVLLDNADRLMLPLIQVAYHFGLRIQEVVDLKRSNINHKDKTLKIKRAKTRYPWQILPFDKEETDIHNTYAVLNSYLLFRKDNNDAMFVTSRNTPIAIRTINKKFRQTLELAARYDSNIRKLYEEKSENFHALRHSCATNIIIKSIEKGKPISLLRVQLWLGHKRSTNTLRYIHLASKYLGKDILSEGLVIQ